MTPAPLCCIVALDGTASIPLLVATTGWAPTSASATPTFTVYDASGAPLVQNKPFSALSTVTGGYYATQGLRAASGFAAGGIYPILISYRMRGAGAVSVRQRRQCTIIQVG